MKISTNIPDDVWKNIWSWVEPTPVDMGALRALSKQYQRVMDDDTLWTQYSPKSIANGLSLRNAFMSRLESRSVRGNGYLAAVYRQELSPIIEHEWINESRRQVEVAAFRRPESVLSLKYDEILPYLRKSFNGRDDDFDAACSMTAPVEFWKNFSAVICNDSTIVKRMIPKMGGVLEYVGKQFHTPDLIKEGLKNNGKVLFCLARRYRDDAAYAQLAVWSSPWVYLMLNDDLKNNYNIARIHTQRHPDRSADPYRYFGVDFSLVHPNYIMQLAPRGLYRRDYEMIQDENFMRALLSVNAHAIEWISSEYNDRADYIQIVWRSLSERQDQQQLELLRSSASPRLQKRWHQIDTQNFLCPDEKSGSFLKKRLFLNG